MKPLHGSGRNCQRLRRSWASAAVRGRSLPLHHRRSTRYARRPRLRSASCHRRVCGTIARLQHKGVGGDHYSAGWVSGAWQKAGIRYIKSELAKSDLYLETLPLFTRGLVRLPDHPKLIRELRLLERHTHRSGRDTVDHGRNGHDDHSNACCGVLRDLSNHLGYDHRGFLDRDEHGNVIDDATAYRRIAQFAYLSSGGAMRWPFMGWAR